MATTLFASTVPAQDVGSGGEPREFALDIFNVVVGASASNDSNVFRRPDAFKQSDTIATAYVGLKLDKSYHRQRFQLDITKNTTRYDKFSYLDFDALNYGGAWLWQLGPRLSGKLSANRSENLAPFEDTLGTQRNVRINQDEAFTFDWFVSGSWHLVGGLAYNSQKSDQITLGRTQADFRSIGADLGIRYEHTPGNSLTAALRSTNGEYRVRDITPASPISDYDETESELKGTWTLTGKSALKGRLAWRDRQHEQVPARDFSGWVGDATYTWLPTGKLTLALSAARNITSQGLLGASTATTDTFSFTPVWQVTPKFHVRMNLSRQNSDYPGVLGTGLFGSADTTDRGLLGLTWSPYRTLTVGANVQHERRSSDDPLRQYEATRATIDASFAF